MIDPMRKEAVVDLGALPPHPRDLTLLARIVWTGSEPMTRSRNPGPGPALELRPRRALSSAQVKDTVADLVLPGNPGQFTCYLDRTC